MRFSAAAAGAAADRHEGWNVSMTEHDEELLTPSEVAKLFRVDPKTVTRWAKAGRLSSIRTLGGHRRYRASEVRRLMDWEERQDED